MTMTFRIWGVVLAGMFVASCGQQDALDEKMEDVRAADLILTGLNVIDVESGGITADQAIIIRGGEIVDIRASNDVGGWTASETRDHAGDYAIPGLWDMHIHLRGGPELAAANAIMLSRYMAYGITGVRDAAGELPDEVSTWRNEIAAGTRVGPKIFTALRKLDGSGGGWPGSIPIDTVDDVAAALDQMVAGGADFIKIYNASIAPDMYLAALAGAEARGLRTAAHLPFAVSFEDIMLAGLDSVEHAMYLHKAASPEDAAISAEIMAAIEAGDGPRSNAFERLIATQDDDYARAMFERMRQRGMAVTPTMYIDHLLQYLDQDDHSDDPEMADIPTEFAATYAGRVERGAARSAEAIASGHARVDATMALLPLVEESGVLILAGSDSGAFNSHVYPGDSLHHEMRMLVKAGVSPLAALQAATINGAIWLGESGHHGTLATGKAADILILTANPLEDINNTRLQAALVRAGRYITADELDAMKRLD